MNSARATARRSASRERTDAVSIVVSEENGRISVAADGRMHARLDDAALRGLLDRLLAGRKNGSAA